MADQVSIQGRVNSGFAAAATKLGAPCAWYRPNGTGNPLAPANQAGTLQAFFDTAANMQQRAPRRREKPEDWYGGFDATNVLVGDYIVEPTLGTFFVTALDFFRPARMVLCNQVLSFSRPSAQVPGTALQRAGPTYYGGAALSTNTPLLTAWPGALVQGTKGEGGELKAPGDVRLPWAVILLPACSGIELLTGDWVQDAEATPRFYTLSMCELTANGWRFSASLASA